MARFCLLYSTNHTYLSLFIVLILKQLRKWCVIILIFDTLTIFAQQINVGGGVGAFNYKGDIATQFKIQNYRPGAHAFFRYNVSPAVSLRTGIALGSVGAKDQNSSDPFQRVRNLSFQSSVTELNFTAEYNFLNYLNKPRAINWTPYLFAGGAFYRFQPKVKTGAYSLNQIAIPFGVGVKWEIKRPWSIEFEFGTRKLFTDDLDDLGNDTPLVQKFQLGDPSTKDMYYYTSFTLSYTFYKIVCPPNFSVY